MKYLDPWKQPPLIGQRRVKVLLATPMGSSLLGETAMFIAATVSRLRDIGAQSGWQKAEGTYVHLNQNKLVMVALETKADVVLFVDSDMSGPVNLAERLMSRLNVCKLDIVGLDYRLRQPPHHMAGMKLDGTHATGDEKGLEEFDFLPSGFLMVRRNVFTTLKYPWFFNTDGEKFEDFTGNDVNFCRKARAAGFKVWCDHDLSNEIYHNGILGLARKGDTATVVT